MSSSFFGSRAVDLLRKEGMVTAAEALANKKYILLYFSAHWCPPCRSFTPRLKAFYEQHSDKLNFEVIFISRDQSAEEMQSYFNNGHGPWLCMSYRDAQTIGETLGQQYGVSFIPMLVVLENTEQRPVVTYYGRDMVDRDPAALQFPWVNADAILVAARRAFMWRAAAVVVFVILVLCFLVA